MIGRALAGEPGNEPCLLAGKEPCLLADLLAMLAGLEDLSERSESESSSSPRNGTRSLSVEPAAFSFCASAPPPPRAAASRSLIVSRSFLGDDGGDFCAGWLGFFWASLLKMKWRLGFAPAADASSSLSLAVAGAASSMAARLSSRLDFG